MTSLRDIWGAQAEAWIRFARDPAGDGTNLFFNIPRFLELLPAPGRRTLDLGCGEGRLGAELARRGHAVVGVDASRAMVEAAAELIEAIVADATALPFDDGAFDLVVAFMSLQDFDDLDAAIHEAARVLEPGGRLCFAVVHPINSAGAFEDGTFAIAGSYFEERPLHELVERDGHRITFAMRHRSLERYSRALEAAGLVLETLREPAHPQDANWSRVPLFLHGRAIKA